MKEILEKEIVILKIFFYQTLTNLILSLKYPAHLFPASTKYYLTIKKETNMVDSKLTEIFKSNLRGQLVLRGDAGFEQACKVYNGMIHKNPFMIAYCADVADVITAVNFGCDNKLLVAVRGGGHNGGGLGICDDGLVIDLSRIKYTRVDTDTKTIRVGGGCTWGDVDHATHMFGYATPSGIVSTTGVGGLTLGGGLGHLTRKCGLTIDNLLKLMSYSLTGILLKRVQMRIRTYTGLSVEAVEISV